VPPFLTVNPGPRQSPRTPGPGSAARGGLALLVAGLVLSGCSYPYGHLALAAVEPTELRLGPTDDIVSSKDCTLYAFGLLPLSRVVQDVGLAVKRAVKADANALTEVTITRRVTYTFLYSEECVEVRGRATGL
jgi:hypothetical protein